MEHLKKGVLLDVRHQQQEFVSAVPDQAVRLPDILSDHVDHRLKGMVTRPVSVCIVVGLQIVHIDHGDSRRVGLIFYFILKITAVVDACEGIRVNQTVIFHQSSYELIASVLIDKVLAVLLLQHLHHIRLAVDLHVSRRHLVHLSAEKFQL